MKTYSIHCLGRTMAMLGIIWLCSIANVSAQNADRETTTWVKDALKHDQRIHASQLDVVTHDGIVTLTGHVPTIAAQRYAVQEAEKIKGVTGVTDELQVDVEKLEDIDIVHDVQQRLEHNATIETKHLHVTCLDGQVTLDGEVADYAEEQEAGLVASEVRGVRGVNNYLISKYSGKHSDDQIERDVWAALNRDVYLSGLPFNVNVKDGEVTLTGKVGNAYEKSRASDEIHQIEQVKAVNNRLAVDPSLGNGVRTGHTWPSEEALQASLKEDLDHDSRIDAADITVDVEYGHAVLDGSVTTNREKRIAEQDAYDIVGVTSVANHLTINAPLCDDHLLDTLIESELRSDAMLHRFDLGIHSAAGTVTITGKVDTVYEKTHAEDVVGHVRGVRSIDNRISVSEAKRLSDAELKAAIQSRLKHNRETSFCGDDIRVEVLNGVAVLSGSVDLAIERYQAERVAFHTAGIWKVENRLVIEGVDYPWEEWQQEIPKDFDGLFFPRCYFNYG
ncbi:MAG: BON domain-containing protein [Planctomycetales bacterium]|nr:BON domain-containing protein [Planctomycetales bacterium]